MQERMRQFSCMEWQEAVLGLAVSHNLLIELNSLIPLVFLAKEC